MSLRRWTPRLAVALGVLAVLWSLRPPTRSGLDLDAFSALPLLHNGRVKPFDTLARSSLLMLRGKQSARDGERKIEASQWLLDVMAKPEAADRYKVFMINDPDVLALAGKRPEDGRFYSFADLAPALEEVRAQAGQAQRLEAAQRDRFQAAVVNLEARLTLYQRLKNTLQAEDTEDMPTELAVFSSLLIPGAKAVQAHGRGGRYDRQALEGLSAFFGRYRFLSRAAAFRHIPPVSGDNPEGWLSTGDVLLSALKGAQPHPALMHYALLAQAYRRGDEKAFNEAVAEQASWAARVLPKTARRARWEVLFNRVQPFYGGIILYAAVLLLCFLSWLFWPDELRRAAYGLLLLTLALHTTGLAVRMWLEGRPPVTNLYSSAVFIGWFSVLLAVLLERFWRKGFATLAAAVLGASTLIIAHNLTGSGDTMEMMRAVLDSNFWLATHVVAVTIGYSSTFLAGILAHVYILRGLLTKSLDKENAKSLASATYGVVCFSLFFSFVGTVLGGIWADQSWGRFWGWDPKENGALLIVLWNAIILHARLGGYVRDRGVMVMAVFGNIITSLSWFGVNMLGIGLHSYGFMDKAFWALAAFAATQLLVMALGSLPRRFWRSVSVSAA
jgi:ABC-type transport system involved in cytochrome c biogenesis permease subunit